VDGFGGDDGQPDGDRPPEHRDTHFSSTRSMTTGVFARIEMQTEVLACPAASRAGTAPDFLMPTH